MSNNEEIQRLESEIETYKRNLHDDAVQINDKFEETKAQLNPVHFVRERLGLSLGLALLSGIGAYFVVGRRGVNAAPINNVNPGKIAKPAAQAMLAQAARKLATRAARGR